MDVPDLVYGAAEGRACGSAGRAANVSRPSPVRWEGGTRAAFTGYLALHGGIVPTPRRRALVALRLEEREEISRGHCGGPVDPADRPRPRTGAIDGKPGDQAQRRQPGLPCKPGRPACLGSGVAPQTLSPGASCAATMARSPEAGAAMVAGADRRLAEAAVPNRSKTCSYLTKRSIAASSFRRAAC